MMMLCAGTMSAIEPSRTSLVASHVSAFGGQSRHGSEVFYFSGHPATKQFPIKSFNCLLKSLSLARARDDLAGLASPQLQNDAVHRSELILPALPSSI
jgi:hypothetical protein